MSIFYILKQLESTNSRKEKESILKNIPEKDVELFKKILVATYDPRLSYYIKDWTFDNLNVTVEVEDVSLDSAIDFLRDSLDSRKVTGHEARAHVLAYYEAFDDDGEAEIFKRIVARDLKCGISGKTINKIWKGLIYECPYMRCASFSTKTLSKVRFPCYSQLKMDGLYVNISVDDLGEIHCQTRSGQYVDRYLSEEVKNILSNAFKGLVLHGEAVCVDEDGFLMDRKQSNGYLDRDDLDVDRIRFFFWDVVDYHIWNANDIDKTPYNVRFDSLVETLHVYSDVDSLNVVETITCNSKEDIIEHFRAARLAGEEGTVIKDFRGEWSSGTSDFQIKMKVIFDCEVRIVGYKMGKGKLADTLGAVLYESEDGMICGSCGGGYTEKQRAELLKSIDGLIEKRQVFTIRGNDVVYNENDPTKFSIYLPRYVEIRNDKDEADTCEKIQNQVKSFTDALDLIK